jgi:pre-mRNA-processing factor 39
MADSSLLHNFPQWEKLNKDLEDDPFSDKLWNELVSHHQKLITDHQNLLTSRKELKSLLYSDFDKLLTKFPYFTKYWKQYANIVKTLEGLSQSIDIIKRSIVVFPYSLDLWVDYMSSILINRYKNDTEIYKLFKEGSEKAGYHFLAHEFWDLYLNWARGKYGTNSLDYISILSKVVEIPLHQYAKYAAEFSKLRQNFTIIDLVAKEKIVDYINDKRLNEQNENIDEFIENNSQMLIETFYDDVLKNVQIRAHDKWKYESSVKLDFDLNVITTDELTQWSLYLDYEENYHKSNNKIQNNKELISLYERSLVPTCFTDQIWIRYLRYLIQNKAEQSRIISNFNKACDHFVPLDLKDIRYMYVKFMDLKMNNIESCKNIFISMVEKLPTDAEVVSKYVEFLIDKVSGIESKRNDLFRDLLNCVHKFNEFSEPRQIKRKKNIRNQNRDLTIQSKDIAYLSKFLNFWTIGQLVVNVCRYKWLIEKDIKTTRDTLMGFFGTEAVRSSKSYWFFFFKFEMSMRNKKNLAHITENVKTATTLNVSDINLIIEQYNSFVLKNCTITELKNNERDIVKNFLEIDFESSMHMKHFLKIRLAESADVDIIDKRIIKENGHPAASCEGRPTLINPILLTDNILNAREAYPLPKFRNVEKANLNVKYIHESL